MSDNHEPVSNRNNFGNAAAMREALELFIQLADDGVIQPRSVGEADEHCFCVLEKMARAALAAPPRNCDRFGPYKQARSEWWETEVLPRVYGVISGAEKPFDEWLFDLATEQKGDK